MENKNGMKNDLKALNDYLFEELERLNDNEELESDEQLEREIKRSKAITNVAQSIIDNANLVLSAQKYSNEYGGKKEMPKMLSISDRNE